MARVEWTTGNHALHVAGVRGGTQVSIPLGLKTVPALCITVHGDNLLFITNHQEISYGIKSRTDGTEISEMIAQGDLDMETEIIPH